LRHGGTSGAAQKLDEPALRRTGLTVACKRRCRPIPWRLFSKAGQTSLWLKKSKAPVRSRRI